MTALGVGFQLRCIKSGLQIGVWAIVHQPRDQDIRLATLSAQATDWHRSALEFLGDENGMGKAAVQRTTWRQALRAQAEPVDLRSGPRPDRILGAISTTSQQDPSAASLRA